MIDGGCPLMFGPTADVGHKAMRVRVHSDGQGSKTGVSQLADQRLRLQMKVEEVDDAASGVVGRGFVELGRHEPSEYPDEGGDVIRIVIVEKRVPGVRVGLDVVVGRRPR